jgi:hypothetical protein
MKSLFIIFVAVILFAVYFINREKEKGRKLQLHKGFQPDWSRNRGSTRRRRPLRRGRELRPDWSRVGQRPPSPGESKSTPSSTPESGDEPSTGGDSHPPAQPGVS